MNWRLGFLRIWSVLTVAWCVGMGGWLYGPVFGDNPNRYVRDYRVVAFEPYAVPFDLQDGEQIDGIGKIVKQDIEVRDAKGTLYYRDGISSVTLDAARRGMQNDLARYQRSYDQARSGVIPVALAYILVPPLLLIGMGVVIGRIARGFTAGRVASHNQ